MNKISPIDIRVAVLTYPLMNKGETPLSRIGSLSSTMIDTLSPSLNRVVDIFHSKPKSSFEQPASKLPPLLRKGEFLLINLVESIKDLYNKWMQEEEIDLYPQRTLRVPTLPYPPFQAPRPARYFWHPKATAPKDIYTPPCLMRDTSEDLPSYVEQSAALCAYARHVLPQKGRLRKDSDGLLYLELPSDYISQLFPLLHVLDAESVPLSQVDPTAAHVPVMTPHEYLEAAKWGEIRELNQEFNFEVHGCFSLSPKLYPGMDKVYCLKVSSPGLEELREKYLLPSKIGTHPFHIVIGFQRKKEGERPQPETFRLNISCFAA
ncbi:MAG: hypothetical protein JSR39_00995 [Verrucomicrobia bacterium]|nr:hypothetical protein [Verrucomicrobiota bacterium]